MSEESLRANSIQVSREEDGIKIRVCDDNTRQAQWIIIPFDTWERIISWDDQWRRYTARMAIRAFAHFSDTDQIRRRKRTIRQTIVATLRRLIPRRTHPSPSPRPDGPVNPFKEK